MVAIEEVATACAWDEATTAAYAPASNSLCFPPTPHPLAQQTHAVRDHTPNRPLVAPLRCRAGARGAAGPRNAAGHTFLKAVYDTSCVTAGRPARVAARRGRRRGRAQASRRAPARGARRAAMAPAGVARRGRRRTYTDKWGSTEGVRWKGYPSRQLHAAAFRVAKTP